MLMSYVIQLKDKSAVLKVNEVNLYSKAQPGGVLKVLKHPP